jgi:hypothetical protein
MSTSYTDNLRLAIQGLGDNNNTWGDVANNGIFERLEDAIAGFVSVNLTGSGDYTLSVANGAYDQARNAILRLGGTPAAARTVLIPAASKIYAVECTVSASVSITLKATGGVGVSCQPGQKFWMYCDGLNSYRIQPGLLDLGVTATAGELNILDGATVTVGELNILDGVTITVGELNILDGATVTVGELNLLDGVTATTAELNILDGVTATAGELNTLDGISSAVSAGILNLLAGLSVSAGAINAAISQTSSESLHIDGYVYLSVNNGSVQASPVVMGNIATVSGNSDTDGPQVHIVFTSAYSSVRAYLVDFMTGRTGGSLDITNSWVPFLFNISVGGFRVRHRDADVMLLKVWSKE